MIKLNVSQSFADKGHFSISAGYKSAEIIINHPSFLEKLIKKTRLTYTDDSIEEVCAVIRNITQPGVTCTINVEPYYYKNSSVIGMTKGSGTIYVNLNGSRNRSTVDYLRNALHELGHFPFGYRHGNNFPNGWRARLLGDLADKNFSVPYILEEVGVEVFSEIFP